MPVSRDEVVEALGGKCVDCGTTENLEVHYGANNKDRYGINTYRKYRAALREPDKFDLRCGNCRNIRSRQRLDVYAAQREKPDEPGVFEGELAEDAD